MELVSMRLAPSMLCKLGFPDCMAVELPEPPTLMLPLEGRYTSAEPILVELVSLLLEPSMLRKLGFRDYLAEVLPEPLSSKLSLEVR